MPRSKPKAHRLAPPRHHSETHFYTTPSCSQPKGLETQQQLHSSLSNHCALPEQVLSADPSGPKTASRNTALQRLAEVTHSSSDREPPRAYPLSCASSDTASVGLAEHIPQPEARRSTPRFVFEKHPIRDAFTPNKNQRTKRNANGRVSNNASKQTEPFQTVLLHSSKPRKNVEADPTPPKLPPALHEVPSSAQTETTARGARRKFSFLADDEAKSIFDHGAGNVNSEMVQLSQRVDKDELRDYWKELETVSIRKSNQAERASGKRRQIRLKQMVNHVPCLDPDNQRLPSELKQTANATMSFKHCEVLSVSKDARKEEMLHPITEENLDGGDAILPIRHRKRKSQKKGKSGSAILGCTTDKETEGHPFEQKIGREIKRKKTSTLRWPPRMNNTKASGERMKAGEVSFDGMGTAIGRGHGSEVGDDTASSTGFSESDGQACMECGRHGKASKMVLCDGCSDGCHTFCMRPARTSVPLGVWICPRCHKLAKKHEIHLSQLSAFVENHGLQCEKDCIS